MLVSPKIPENQGLMLADAMRFAAGCQRIFATMPGRPALSIRLIPCPRTQTTSLYGTWIYPDVLLKDTKVGALLIVIGTVFLFAAGSQHLLALREVQRWLPEQLRDEETASWAFDTFVWNNLVPSSARRQYLRAMIFASISLASIAGAILTHGDRIPALLFAGLSVLAAVLAFWRWLKHRGQF